MVKGIKSAKLNSFKSTMDKVITINGSTPNHSVCTGVNQYHSSSSHKSSVTRRGGHLERRQPFGGVQDSNDEDIAGVGGASKIQLRNRNLRKKELDWRKFAAPLLAFLVPVMFPIVHMRIFKSLWGHMKIPVEKYICTCSCWDTVFKGPYEAGLATYKHVYFNSDGNTLKIWVITVLWVLFFYEGLKRLFSLLLRKKLRWSMGILFLSSLYSHYFAWWAHWNYWNDDFYSMWYHQAFFTVTELISTILVLNYLNVRHAIIEPIPMFIICSIAAFHVFCSGLDQFVASVVLGNGEFHQNIRNVALMVTDIAHVTLSFREIKIYAVRRGMSLLSVLLHRKHLAVVLGVIGVMSSCVLLFPSDREEVTGIKAWRQFRN